MTGRTKERLAELILEHFRETRESTLQECRKALGFGAYDGSLNSAISRLTEAGAIECIKSRGNKFAIYRYLKEPDKHIGKAAELQEKAWRAMRIAKTFTAWDVALLSGASLDYVHGYIRSLKRGGLLKKVGQDPKQREILKIEGKPPKEAPRAWEATSRKEAPIQEAIALGWEMMRALRQGNKDKAMDACVKILGCL